MILISLPDHAYYRWQMLVQITAMRELGWLDRTRWLLYCSGTPSAELREIMDTGMASITVWADWQRDQEYHAAMKPWLVGKWLNAHPEQVTGHHLLIDPDAVPTGRRFPTPLPGVLHGTDTHSYTGEGYLRSKGAWLPLCELVGVDPARAAAYLGVGAQVAWTGLSGDWWEDVAQLSVDAFHLLKTLPTPPDGVPVQSWCAEMYITQLVAIRDGLTPRVEPTMDMVWANGPAVGWQTSGFFHNAGVMEEDGEHFCKLSHQTGPWGKVLPVSVTSASARYVELIRATEQAWNGQLSFLRELSHV